MVQLFTQFGQDSSSSSGIGALGVSGSALLIQLLTFLLAYFVLRKYAFKPILKVLQDRRELIESGVKLGEDMQKQRAVLDQTVQSTLREARLKADAIVADANDAGRDVQREAEDKARAKAENIQAEAHSRAEQEVGQMRKALMHEVVGLVSDATEAIIDEKVDSTKDSALIDRALKQQKQTSARSAEARA